MHLIIHSIERGPRQPVCTNQRFFQGEISSHSLSPDTKFQLRSPLSGKQWLSCPVDLQCNSHQDPQAKHQQHVILVETMPKCMERHTEPDSHILKTQTSKQEKLPQFRASCLWGILPRNDMPSNCTIEDQGDSWKAGLIIIHSPFSVAFTNEMPRKKTYVCSKATTPDTLISLFLLQHKKANIFLAGG